MTRNMNNRWAFCTKMAFAKDSLATIRATAAFKSGYTNEIPKNVQLFVFGEEQWEKVLKDEDRAEGRVTCEKMGNASRFRDLIYFNDGK